MVNAAKRGASNEIHSTIKNALPPEVRQFVYQKDGPDDESGMFLPQVENPPEEVDYGYEEGDEMEYGIAFEDSDAAQNLANAAAAWRILGHEGDIVAQNGSTGIAFFGPEEDLDAYCDQHDLNANNWTVYETTQEIMDLEADENSFRKVLPMLREENMDGVREQFSGFHWGDNPAVTSIKQIDGITKPLTFLGVAREICYGAMKEGEFHEYYHIHGEDSGTYPSIYALGDDCYVVHGGKMTIEDRGIVD